MTALLTALIDKQDNSEIVRDKIATILAEESASQMLLAEEESENPLDWKLRVFLERNNPWEQVLNSQSDSDLTPLVNVWYDKSNFDLKGSNAVERQKCEGIFNIDCYGFAVSKDVEGGGHLPGDLKASLEVQRCVRLVRNILMSGAYTYLGFPRGGSQVVWGRWISSIQIFQPQTYQGSEQNNDIDIVKTCGARISLMVTFNELSPQVEPVDLEYLSACVKRLETGEVIVNAEYDYTA